MTDDDDTPPVVKAPLCPGCGGRSLFTRGHQAICGNPQCRVFGWDPYDDPARFKAKARTVDLSGEQAPP
jgi:hypothetical protein